MVEMLVNKGVDAMRLTKRSRLGRGSGENGGEKQSEEEKEKEQKRFTPWNLAKNFPNIQALLPHVLSEEEEKEQKRTKMTKQKKKSTEGDSSSSSSSSSISSSSAKSSSSNDDDWGTGDVLADGLRKGMARRENDVLADPLFHDPTFYLREKDESNPRDENIQVVGAGGALHNKDSYENEVLNQITMYEDYEKEKRKKEAKIQKDGEEEEMSLLETDALLEASLILGFEDVAAVAAAVAAAAEEKTGTNASLKTKNDPLFGKAPSDALVALLAHRAPGMHVKLRERMMATPRDPTLTREEIRAALMEVGAYWSTTAKPAGRRQREASETCRTKGNSLFKERKWLDAAACYTEALQHLSGGSTRVHEEERDYVGRLLSNRSAARCSAGQYHSAAYDAFELVLDLLPAWPKSYLRLGKACESMGGHDEAKTWYECGAKCAKMLGEEKQRRELSKHAKRCVTTLKAEKPTLPSTLPELNDILSAKVKNEDIAENLGLDSPLLYVPVHDGGRLDRTHGVDRVYMKEITKRTNVEIKKVPRENGVGGDRGL